MPVIRRGEAGDLESIARIQSASPEAAHWDPADYLSYELRVSVEENHIAGFMVWRRLSEGEYEVLNLAVDPEFRRRGVARSLWEAVRKACPGTFFLEVRGANQTAQVFYKSMGFKVLSYRKDYYQFPSDTAIVMKFHSC